METVYMNGAEDARVVKLVCQIACIKTILMNGIRRLCEHCTQEIHIGLLELYSCSLCH